MEILLALFGFVAGSIITHIYARRSLNDLKKVENRLREDNKVIIEELKRLSLQLTSTQPAIADQITEIINKYEFGPGAEPAVIGGIDSCPTCHRDTLSFTRYGVGPLGVNNAWYQCKTCGYEFQTNESSED